MHALVTGPQMLIDLANELVEVVWWYDLGLHLKAPRHVLETIRVDHSSNEDQKRALFGWWLSNTLEEERKWSRIVIALATTGYRSLAEKIALKYGKKTNACRLSTLGVSILTIIIIVFTITGVPVPAPQETCAASEQDTTWVCKYCI